MACQPQERNAKRSRKSPAPDPAAYLAAQGNTRKGFEFLDSERKSVRSPDTGEVSSGLQIAGEILVGEMRDTEATQVALRAALTGHLVLSSLHTKDAVSTISRLQDMGIERYPTRGKARAHGKSLRRRSSSSLKRTLPESPQTAIPARFSRNHHPKVSNVRGSATP